MNAIFIHTSKFLIINLVFLYLSGCAQTNVKTRQDVEITEDSVSVILMPIDIELSALTAGGVNEVRADWTKSAKTLVTAALKRGMSSHNDKLLSYSAPNDNIKRDQHNQIIKLHGAVGSTMLQYASAPITAPPTKKGGFDWTLGQEVSALREDNSADYGLFVYLRDSYSTAGRRALIMAAAIAGVGIQGGMQTGFATLIDLNDGSVVWFNHLLSPTGDLRTEKSASSAIDQLLKDIPL